MHKSNQRAESVLLPATAEPVKMVAKFNRKRKGTMSLLLDKIQFMEELKNRIKQYQNFLDKLKVQDKVRVRLEDSFDHAELKKEDFREGFIEEKRKELERTYNKISSKLWDIDESLDEYDGTPNIDKYLVKNDS